MSIEEPPKSAKKKKKKKPKSTSDDAKKKKKKKPPKASDEEQPSDEIVELQEEEEQEKTNADTNDTDAPKPASKKKKKKKKTKNGEGEGSSTPKKKKKKKAKPVDEALEAKPVDEAPESTTFVPVSHSSDVESLSKEDVEDRAGVPDLEINAGNTDVDGVTAVEVANTTPNGERKSALFFGSCCDLVTATIIVDIIYLIVNCVYLIAQSQLKAYFQGFSGWGAEWGELNRIINAYISKFCISMAFCLVGITGAARLNVNLVRVAAVLFSIEVIPNFIVLPWWVALVGLVFVPYPHIALAFELSKGNITPENYRVREAHCCCCPSGCCPSGSNS